MLRVVSQNGRVSVNIDNSTLYIEKVNSNKYNINAYVSGVVYMLGSYDTYETAKGWFETIHNNLYGSKVVYLG